MKFLAQYDLFIENKWPKTAELYKNSIIIITLLKMFTN